MTRGYTSVVFLERNVGRAYSTGMSDAWGCINLASLPVSTASFFFQVCMLVIYIKKIIILALGRAGLTIAMTSRCVELPEILC